MWRRITIDIICKCCTENMTASVGQLFYSKICNSNDDTNDDPPLDITYFPTLIRFHGTIELFQLFPILPKAIIPKTSAQLQRPTKRGKSTDISSLASVMTDSATSAKTWLSSLWTSNSKNSNTNDNNCDIYLPDEENEYEDDENADEPVVDKWWIEDKLPSSLVILQEKKLSMHYKSSTDWKTLETPQYPPPSIPSKQLSFPPFFHPYLIPSMYLENMDALVAIQCSSTSNQWIKFNAILHYRTLFLQPIIIQNTKSISYGKWLMISLTDFPFKFCEFGDEGINENINKEEKENETRNDENENKNKQIYQHFYWTDNKSHGVIGRCQSIPIITDDTNIFANIYEQSFSQSYIKYIENSNENILNMSHKQWIIDIAVKYSTKHIINNTKYISSGNKNDFYHRKEFEFDLKLLLTSTKDIRSIHFSNKELVKKCENDCQRVFSTFLRKYRCEFCGRIICTYCGDGKLLNHITLAKQRACLICRTEHFQISGIIEPLQVKRIKSSGKRNSALKTNAMIIENSLDISIDDDDIDICNDTNVYLEQFNDVIKEYKNANYNNIQHIISNVKWNIIKEAAILSYLIYETSINNSSSNNSSKNSSNNSSNNSSKNSSSSNDWNQTLLQLGFKEIDLISCENIKSGEQQFVHFGIFQSLTTNYYYLVFRGSYNLWDWITNVQAMPFTPFKFGFVVHSGMYVSLQQMALDHCTQLCRLMFDSSYVLLSYMYYFVCVFLLKIGDKNLVICGHSLGGGYAQILAAHLLCTTEFKLNLEVITFGAPLVIEKQSRCSLSETQSEMKMDEIPSVDRVLTKLQQITINIINQFDIVPRLGLLSIDYFMEFISQAMDENLHWSVWAADSLLNFNLKKMLQENVFGRKDIQKFQNIQQTNYGPVGTYILLYPKYKPMDVFTMSNNSLWMKNAKKNHKKYMNNFYIRSLEGCCLFLDGNEILKFLPKRAGLFSNNILQDHWMMYYLSQLLFMDDI